MQKEEEREGNTAAEKLEGKKCRSSKTDVDIKFCFAFFSSISLCHNHSYGKVILLSPSSSSSAKQPKMLNF